MVLLFSSLFSLSPISMVLKCSIQVNTSLEGGSEVFLLSDRFLATEYISG